MWNKEFTLISKPLALDWVACLWLGSAHLLPDSTIQVFVPSLFDKLISSFSLFITGEMRRQVVCSRIQDMQPQNLCTSSLRLCLTDVLNRPTVKSAILMAVVSIPLNQVIKHNIHVLVSISMHRRHFWHTLRQQSLIQSC